MAAFGPSVNEPTDFNQKQKDRSTSLAGFALLSFLVLGICTLGAHTESLEYDRRVFGYYAALLTRPQELVEETSRQVSCTPMVGENTHLAMTPNEGQHPTPPP